MDNEAAQQALGQGISRVADAITKLQAAHTSLCTATVRGGPDFAPRLRATMEQLDNLFADMQEIHGEVEPHRGLRTGPTCENDPRCPVHGPSVFSQESREQHYKCIGPPTRENEDIPPVQCDDPSCPIHGDEVRQRTGPHKDERLFSCSVAAYNRVKES
jgi:hypothetical protein